MKYAPRTIYLTVLERTSEDGRESEQLVFRSLKAARSAASKHVREMRSRDGATVTGSVRSGRIDVSDSGVHLTAVVSHITDPMTVRTLWRFWMERRNNV